MVSKPVVLKEVDNSSLLTILFLAIWKRLQRAKDFNLSMSLFSRMELFIRDISKRA